MLTPSRRRTGTAVRRRPAAPGVEPLEARAVPSATLVKTVNTATAGSMQATSAATVNGAAYFTASGPQGNGLWKTDGTPAGTVLVKAFNAPLTFAPGNLTAFNGKLFFTADDGVHGTELWESDGTAAGTALLTDINPTADFNQRPVGSYPASLTVVNGTLFFTADDYVHGRQLWKTDGTAAGTVMVKAIDARPSFGSDPANLTAVNGTLFFTTNDYVTPPQLWKSDGTDAGTVPVMQIAANNLANVNGTLYFAGSSTFSYSGGGALWKSDGTPAGTVKVRDVSPTALTASNGKLFFVASTGPLGAELWESNGTSAGTTLVKDVNPGPAGANPSNLTAANGGLYFMADDGTHGPELWKTDGTAAGTVLVKDINPGGQGSLPTWPNGAPYPLPPMMASANGKLFLAADDGTHGTELWTSDGTAAGTVLVKDINPGVGGADPSLPVPLASVGGKLFFAADDGSHGVEPWVSDGTAAGTLLLKDIQTSALGSFPSQITTTVRGTTFFVATDSEHGQELWKTDGTAAGTVLVKDIKPGAGSSGVTALTDVNGTLFFAANDGVHGTDLWKSDGTAAGTVLVKDIGPGLSGGVIGFDYYQNTQPANVNGTLFFVAYDGVHGRELWKSDGTAAGTVMVADLVPGAGGSDPADLTAVNGTLYFTADDGVHGRELWTSDGTAAGTVLVKDINPGPSHAFVYSSHDLTNVAGTLYFSATDGNGSSIWKSDGTAAGTVKVDSGTPLTNVNGTLFYLRQGVNADQLWKTDGTAAGTVEVAQLPGQVALGLGIPAFNVNGTVFLIVSGGGGTQLWKSDGTAAGTVMVKVLNPRGWPPAAGLLTAANGKLYFAADDGVHGNELWQSDGTTAGTVLVQDIAPGPSGSNPQSLAAGSGTLFFSADDGIHGRELWKVGAPVTAGSLSAQGSAVKVQEGQAFSGVVATFSDPGGPADGGSYTASITWGDGHVSAGTVTAKGNGVFAVTGSNTYAQAGSYAVSVKITSAGGDSGTASGTAAVSDAPLYLGRTFFRVRRGQPFSAPVAWLTDTNLLAAAGDFTVSIAWGDGHTSSGTLTQTAPGKFTISAGNTYAATGSYTAAVTVTDRGGRVVSASTLVAVDA